MTSFLDATKHISLWNTEDRRIEMSLNRIHLFSIIPGFFIFLQITIYSGFIKVYERK